MTKKTESKSEAKEVKDDVSESQVNENEEVTATTSTSDDVENAKESEAIETDEDGKTKTEEKLSVEDSLLLRIKELELENEKIKNEYAKAYADTENVRKRLKQEFEVSKKYRIQSFALDILPVMDNLERAISQDGTDFESYKKGVEMIYKQLVYALQKEGVEEIEAEGKKFDHNWHQALMCEKVDGVEKDQVIEVLQKGYKLKDRVLRAAMVKVSE